MTSGTQSQFNVTTDGHQLVIRATTESVPQALCSIDLRHQPSFFMKDGGVVCRDSWGRDFTVDLNGIPANGLIEHIVQARMVPPKPPQKWSRWISVLAIAISTAAAGYYLGATSMTGEPSDVTAAAPAPVLQQQLPPTPPLAGNEVAPQAADDGWELPASIRKQLPVNLANAAGRELFTVQYSTGHARTIYVFADPSCPNCQRLEPALEAAANDFNVVVFPVSMIGKEKSVAAASAVLCLPPEQRKAAWTALYDPGHDALSIGRKPDGDEGAHGSGAVASDCEMAAKALGVNDVAYRTYRIPGTPWAISDDGRYVSQADIRDLDKLKGFLSSEVKADGDK
ncbi:DsbC family protein [Pseudomonas guariconensis]|uniref:DsbC family protein n=1 Tax=Pseudomonas guariconensis TaxID=1288410 RepID=UPI003EE114BD